MHAPWYWIESPDGTPMVSSKVYKNDSFPHKLHYPFMSLIHVGKVFARHPAVRPFLWQKLSCNPYLRSCEKNVRHFSNIVQGKIFEILFDQILCQVPHIHAGFGDFDPFSKSQKEKRESLVFRVSQKWHMSWLSLCSAWHFCLCFSILVHIRNVKKLIVCEGKCPLCVLSARCFRGLWMMHHLLLPFSPAWFKLKVSVSSLTSGEATLLCVGNSMGVSWVCHIAVRWELNGCVMGMSHCCVLGTQWVCHGYVTLLCVGNSMGVSWVCL